MRKISVTTLALCILTLLICAASASVLSIGNGEVTTIGANATVDLVLDEAPAGLAGYSINISFANPNIARVSAVSYPAWAAITDTSALPSSDCRVKATDTGEQVQSGAANITLATVTIEGIAGGTTSVNLVVNMMNDDNDATMSPATAGGTFYTNVPVAPTAAFIANISSGVTPLSVQFTDQSTGIPTSWSWDFGDGGTSTEQNPVHIYTTAGTYTVSLTATNAYGSGLEEKAALVTVSPSFGTIVREWTFESGTEEGFTPVSTWGSGMTLSVSPSAHGGAYALQCYANNGIGYAKAPLLVPPDSRNFLIEYWVKSSATGYGYTDVGISIVDSTGAMIVKMDGSDYDIRVTDHSVICNRPSGWVRHIIQWSQDSGVIDHYAYNPEGTLLGSKQLTRAETVGKMPAEVWCKVRGFSVSHTIQYDDIRISSDSAGWAPPVAEFTSDVLSQDGIVPLTIAFTDQSTMAVYWAWDFGDSTNSTVQNPVHTYNTIGTYTVNLTASNPDGSDSEEKIGYITVNAATVPPVAAFTANTTSGLIPLHVKFSDQSTGKALSWAWDFGDGTTSTEQNATHVYNIAGNYTVVQTVTNAAGSDDETKIEYILAVATAADFSATPTSGADPLTVQFTDLSTGSPTSWFWDFGDGTNSTVKNPSHVFSGIGNYTVNLTTTKGAVVNTVTKTDYIKVSTAAADFTADTTSGPAPWTVKFTDASTGYPTSWVWDFGDGENSTVQNPTHIYTASGNYTVSLTATNPAGSYSVTKTDYISISPTVSPDADFSPSGTAGTAPYFVRFTDTSANYPTSWSWDFGDGGSSTVRSPGHTYMTEGMYTVTLTATNGAGSDTETKTGLITVAAGSGDMSAGPWPKFQRFNNNTGLSSIAGPEAANSIWNFTTGGAIGYAGPAVGSDGTIYVGSYDDKVYALYPDGSQKWNYTTAGDIYGVPAIGPDGTVYIGSFDARLYALNPDGSQKWNYTTGGRIYGSPAIGPDGTIYIGSYDKKFYAINPDGSQKWNVTAGNYFQLSSPAIGPDGTVYIGNYDAKLYAFNPDGTVKWNYAAGSRIYGSPAIGSDGTVYFGSYDKKFYALNPDGTLKWSYTTGNYVYGSPAIGSDGTIYIGGYDAKLYAFNPDGTVKWTFTTGSRIYGSPAIAGDGGIFFGSYDRKVYGLNSDGTERWNFTTGNYVYGSSAIGADGTLYIGSNDNKLYAFYTDHKAPEADFTSSTDTPDLLSPVRFTDMSANFPTSWAWDFGDGTSSTLKNPVHTYTAAGTYTVTLTATNAKGTDTETKTGYITKEILAAPVANFITGTVSVPIVSQVPIQFTDQSTGVVVSRSWNFGDGETSTEMNPVHWYSPGIYTASLTVTNSGGSNTSQETVTANATAAIVKKWTFESGTEEGFTEVDTWGSGMTLSVSPTAHTGANALQCYASSGIGYAKASLGDVPDSSSYGIEYWVRSSANGYGYTNVGIYVVDATGALIAKIDGSDNDIRDTDHTVFVSSRPAGVWLRHVISWDKNTGVIDHYVYYENGDLVGSKQLTRAASVGKIPAEVQCHVRGYSVAHTIQYDDIAFSRAMTPPVAAFTSDIQAGISPLTLQFTDQSTNTPTSWAWTFGDGATSTEQDPVHTFTAPGTYTVTLTVTNADGSDTATKTDYIQAFDPSHPTVLITPQVRNVPIGTTRDFSLSMTSLPSGIAGYNLSVSLSDPGAGEITAITLPAWASLNLSSGVPGDSVWASGLDLARNIEAGATNVPLGTVTVRGDVIGSSPFVVTVHEMDADGGGLISPVVVSGVLNVYQPVALSADFSADNTTGYFPLTVRFSDLSTGIPAPSAWTWSFGDGSANSTARNPVHTYQPGQYTVTLTVSNDLEQVTVMKANYITVTRHVVPFPGCVNEPLDPDHDGRYEDINGNGRLDFHDVVTLYQNMQWVRDNTEVGTDPFDFNGNGRLDYDDIVLLYYEVLAG